MNDSFFRKLRSKLEAKPDRNFDQRFWAKFDAEFGEAPVPGVWVRWRRTILSSAAVAGALLAFVAYRGLRAPDALAPNGAEIALLEDFNQNPELYEDLDLFEGMDELMLTASDEDWEVLLEGTEPVNHDSET